MTLHLYRQTYPTTALVLASSRHTLTFTKPPSTSGPQVELALESIDDLDQLACNYLGQVYGSLGLVQLNNEIYLSVISSAQSLTSRYWPAEATSRIQGVDFISLTSPAWDDALGRSPDGTSTPVGGASSSSSSLGNVPYDNFSFDQVQQGLLGAGSSNQSSQGLEQHPAAAMRKILSNGHFYFSSGGYDISTRLEERIRRRAEGDETAYDSRFVWNGFLMDSILSFRQNLDTLERARFDEANFVVSAIQGFVGVTDFTLSGNPVTLSIISRLGSARAGTRFNMRGVDDDGNVANFVETETIFKTKDSCFSFVQVRGSVPLFWEQSGTTPFGGQKLQITRPTVSSQPAFNKHFAGLLSAYPRIQIVNLLSTKEHEAALSNAYHEHTRNLNAQLGDTESEKPDGMSAVEHGVSYAEFDFHREAKLAGGIESVRDLIKRDPSFGGAIDSLGYCLVALDEKTGETLLHRQEGVFRTNCLDCLDRTNVVQDILSRIAIETYLRNLVAVWASSELLLSAHRTLWAENGDALSRIYAGTGALNTSFTRSGKRTLAGALSDATKSVSRLYISNFVDKGKQMAIDALLGNMAGQDKVVVVDPVRDSVESALMHRAPEYSSESSYVIFAGTFNVNGKVPGTESLLPWLFPESGTEPDVIALGFQELVELSPQQIMATDPAKLRQWQAYIEQAVSRRPNAKADYVLLRSEQLVGTCLIMLINTSIAGHVRNVEAVTKKTGLKGMAGNKGAVAVRLELDDSSFCFVTAHFAAGHSNYEQRNLDYATIYNGLRFRRGKTIASQENIIYFGDLNYRIALANDEVRHLASSKDLATLVQGDQLTKCMHEHAVFAGFTEGPLVFLPTYKYDNGTDQYDTSEKQRVPSWTDRVLFKGDGLSLLKYNRAEVMMSDHRPVYAIFRARVRVVDHAKKAAISKELLQSLGSTKSTTALLGDDSAGDRKQRVKTPDPSSEKATWWEDLDLAVIVLSAVKAGQADSGTTNPFEIPRTSSIGPIDSKSQASHVRVHSIKRKPAPPLPGGKPTASSNGGDRPNGSHSWNKTTLRPVTSPATTKQPFPSISLLDDDQEDDYVMHDGKFTRPGGRREGTNEWQIISPTVAK